ESRGTALSRDQPSSFHSSRRLISWLSQLTGRDAAREGLLKMQQQAAAASAKANADPMSPQSLATDTARRSTTRSRVPDGRTRSTKPPARRSPTRCPGSGTSANGKRNDVQNQRKSDIDYYEQGGRTGRAPNESPTITTPAPATFG